MPDFTACEWLRCKRMAVFFRHPDICFLSTEMSQIEEKRPEAYVCVPFSGRSSTDVQRLPE